MKQALKDAFINRLNFPALSIRSSLVIMDTDPLVLSPTNVQSVRKMRKKDVIMNIKVKKNHKPAKAKKGIDIGDELLTETVQG